MNFLSEEKRAKLSEVLFYVALTIELGIMLLEKSVIHMYSYQSYVYRLTFLMALITVLLLKHDKKEWIIIGAVCAFTFISYRISGKNDLLRYAVFMMAARDIDIKKAMKYILYVSAAGYFLIAFLSVIGKLGVTAQPPHDYGRGVVEMRYELGFGHPNTFYGSVYAFVLLWMWIYGEAATLREWLLVFTLNFMSCVISASRTGMLISFMTFGIGFLARYCKKIGESKIVYILTALVTPVFCVAFSVWSAIVSKVPRYEFEHKHYKFIEWIDSKLNNRIHDLYRETEKHAGSIWTWKLFSDGSSEETFDMGWVRIFYWYGIIPAIVIAALIVLIIYICYKKKDIWTLVIILSLSVYTIVEATFVSEYIGRLFILPVIGAYLGEFVSRKKDGECLRS